MTHTTITKAIAPLLAICLFTLVGGWFAWFWVDPSGLDLSLLFEPWLLALFVGMVIAHEAIHALTFHLMGARDVSWGVKLPSFSPYVHMPDVVTARVYRMSLLTPTLFLVILPMIFAVVAKTPEVYVLALAMLMGSSADLLIVWRLKGVRATQKVMDHPQEVGARVVS